MKERYNELKEDVLDEQNAVDETIERLLKARENLIEQGAHPIFILPTLLRLERNRLLENKKDLVKQES